MRQLGGGLQSILAYDSFQLPIAKRLPHNILSFGHSVGVEQETFGWFKRHAAPSQVRLRTTARYFRYAAFRPAYSTSTVAADVQQRNCVG